MSISRRQFFFGSTALAGLSLAAYSYQRGLRVPPFHWEPRLTLETLGALEHKTSQLLLLPNATSSKSFWRATAPEPKLTLINKLRIETSLEIHNLSPKAVLNVTGAEHEEIIKGTQRQVLLKLSAGIEANLSWSLVVEDEISFAAIGDSGGDLELDWCIQRAKQLNADFLLHLGDFNYQDGDYQRAIDHFKSAPLPVYVSIGNHDFHDSGGVYGRFIHEIGPLNQAFEIAGNRFLNIDTAASFWPLSGGQRGRLFSALRKQASMNTIAFTHSPLKDPDAASNHDIGSEKERAWLIEQLRAVGTTTMLSGHIHINDRSTISGIDHLIIGQGLGHQDLLVGQDHSKIAIGKIDTRGKLELELSDLAMPMQLHCHPRTYAVKDSLRGGQHEKLIETVERACAQRSS